MIRYLLLLLISFISAYLFSQNLLLTENFEVYQIRSMDGMNFQIPLQNIHEFLVELRIGSLFSKLYYFGYHWLFWISLGLLTFPFYLWGSEQLLILTPLIISQLYVLGCLSIFYKILKHFSKDSLLNALLLLTILSFPAIPFFSLYFYCTPAPAFFILLAIYFQLKAPSPKNLWLSALFAAMAIGHKLTAALVLPLLLLMRLQGHQWKLDRKFFQENTKAFFLPLFFFSLFFSNPALLLAPFRPNAIKAYLELMSHVSQFTRSSPDKVNENLLYMFQKGLSHNFLHSYALLTLGIFTAFFAYRHRKTLKTNKPFLLTLYAFSAAFMVLLLVKRAPIILANYYFGFAPLLLLVLSQEKSKLRYLIPTALLTMNLFFNASAIYQNYNAIYLFKASATKALTLLKKEQALIPYQKLNLLMSASLHAPYHPIRKQIQCIYIFDDADLSAERIEGEYDYILLDPHSLSLQPLKQIHKQKDHVTQERLLELLGSHQTLQELQHTQHFKNSNYTLLYKDPDLIVYKMHPEK